MNSYRALGAVYDRLMDADYGAFAEPEFLRSFCWTSDAAPAC